MHMYVVSVLSLGCRKCCLLGATSLHEAGAFSGFDPDLSVKMPNDDRIVQERRQECLLPKTRNTIIDVDGVTRAPLPLLPLHGNLESAVPTPTYQHTSTSMPIIFPWLKNIMHIVLRDVMVVLLMAGGRRRRDLVEGHAGAVEGDGSGDGPLERETRPRNVRNMTRGVWRLKRPRDSETHIATQLLL